MGSDDIYLMCISSTSPGLVHLQNVTIGSIHTVLVMTSSNYPVERVDRRMLLQLYASVPVHVLASNGHCSLMQQHHSSISISVSHGTVSISLWSKSAFEMHPNAQCKKK